MNTRQSLQSDLEALYTGPQLTGFNVFAQMFSMLYAAFTFSSGLPVLYIIAAAFYAMLYLSNKVLLLYWYENTQFSESLPLKSLEVMRYAVILHMLFAVFMYSTEEILPVKAKDQATIGQDAIANKQERSLFGRLFYSGHSQLYMTFVIVFLILNGFWELISRVAAPILQYLSARCVCKRLAVADEGTVEVHHGHTNRPEL